MNSDAHVSSDFSSACHALSRFWKAFFLLGSAFIYASVMAVAMLDRASLENHRCGLSPSMAPMTEAADTIFVVLVIDLVAQES